MSSSNHQEPNEPPVSDYELWRRGYGVIQHSAATCSQARQMASELVAAGLQPDTDMVYRKLASLDRLASAGLWLVAHMTYSNRVDTNGTALASGELAALEGRGEPAIVTRSR